MLAPTLADFLRSRRTDCNARFVAARRRWPQLDPADFTLFLRDQLSPLASAFSAVAPAQAPFALQCGYDLGLQLVAEKLAGPSAGDRSLNTLWSEVFPVLAVHIASAPRRVLGSLCNAAHHLASTPDCRVEFWRDRLVAFAPRCTGTDELLTMAQLLAWRAGLAHYRASALAAADALPPALALAALDAPTHLAWPEVRDAHLSDPWFGYDERQQRLTPATLGRRLGAFRGFGGPFLAPPLVTLSAANLLVRSGEDAWILLADAFGATLQRASADEIAGAKPLVSASSRSALLPAGHTVSSVVSLTAIGTSAVTSAQSHSVWVGPLDAAS